MLVIPQLRQSKFRLVAPVSVTTLVFLADSYHFFEFPLGGGTGGKGTLQGSIREDPDRGLTPYPFVYRFGGKAAPFRYL